MNGIYTYISSQIKRKLNENRAKRVYNILGASNSFADVSTIHLFQFISPFWQRLFEILQRQIVNSQFTRYESNRHAGFSSIHTKILNALLAEKVNKIGETLFQTCAIDKFGVHELSTFLHFSAYFLFQRNFNVFLVYSLFDQKNNKIYSIFSISADAEVQSIATIYTHTNTFRRSSSKRVNQTETHGNYSEFFRSRHFRFL